MEVLANKIPRELEECYRQILERLTTGKSPEMIQDIRKALMWISAAAEFGDVTLESLWEALALLKGDDTELETLDEVWGRQMLISTYDELWRKLYTMCGPFIEIYNPGMSTGESRKHKYRAGSIVQLMHQSVRDFFSNSEASCPLHFTSNESNCLVRDNLTRYLSIVSRDNLRQSSLGPQRPEELVGRLSEQKMLQLALRSVETQESSERSMRLLGGDLALQPPASRSDEELLVSSIEGYLKLTEHEIGLQAALETLSLEPINHQFDYPFRNERRTWPNE
ncbi:hypothetical protein ACJ41O_008889 [Fusarium nematophilum]